MRWRAEPVVIMFILSPTEPCSYTSTLRVRTSTPPPHTHTHTHPAHTPSHTHTHPHMHIHTRHPHPFSSLPLSTDRRGGVPVGPASGAHSVRVPAAAPPQNAGPGPTRPHAACCDQHRPRQHAQRPVDNPGPVCTWGQAKSKCDRWVVPINVHELWRSSGGVGQRLWVCRGSWGVGVEEAVGCLSALCELVWCLMQ
jgi:hypothetical protein